LWSLGDFFREEFANPQWQGTGAFTLPLEDLSGGSFVVGQPQSDAAYGAGLLAKNSLS
jgi:hypothetical protein